MNETKVFTVEVEVHEQPDHAEAKALLDIDGDVRGGWGRARRNPEDPERPRLGEELAIARALSDLAHHLGDDVAAQIAAEEGGSARVHL
jgi:Rv2632c-like